MNLVHGIGLGALNRFRYKIITINRTGTETMTTNFDTIKFNSQFHTYTYQGRRLTNVSKLLEEVTEPFDKAGVAQRVADKQGVPVEAILEEWESSRQTSIDKGHRVHQHIEFVINGGDINDPILAMNTPFPEIEAFNKFWQKGNESLQLYRTEWVIGDSELGIAGTADAVMFHRVNQQYMLFDWKTGKLDTENPYQKMKGVFTGYDDCKLNRYSLQTSIYRLMIERNTDLKIAGAYIVHLSETGDFFAYKAKDLVGLAIQWLQGRL